MDSTSLFARLDAADNTLRGNPPHTFAARFIGNRIRALHADTRRAALAATTTAELNACLTAFNAAEIRLVDDAVAWSISNAGDDHTAAGILHCYLPICRSIMEMDRFHINALIRSSQE
jgi:hypothetical protein